MSVIHEYFYVVASPPLMAALISFFALGIGALLIKPLYGTNRPGIVESFGLGIIFISASTALWGFAGWLTPDGKLTLLFPLILMGLSGWILNRFYTPIRIRSFRNRAIIVLSVLLLLGTVLKNIAAPLVPPISPEACETILPVARTLVETGKLGFQPEIKFGSYPHLVEMIYFWAISYSPLTTAQYLNYFAFIFVLVGMVQLGRSAYSLKTGWLAAVILASITAVQTASLTANADLWILLFLLTAIFLGFDALVNKIPTKLFLAGIFAGAAAEVRFYGAISSACLLLSLISIFGWYRKRKEKIQHDDFNIMFLIAIACGIPWYIINVIWFHNPIFPFSAETFPPGAGYFGAVSKELIVDFSWYFKNFNLAEIYSKGNFWTTFLLVYSPGWAIFPASIWFWRSNPLLRFLSMAAALTWLYWSVFGNGIILPNVMIPLAIGSSLAVAHLLTRLYTILPGTERGRSAKMVCWLILITWISVGGILRTYDTPPVTYDETDSYLADNLSSYILIDAANDIIDQERGAVGVMCGNGRLYADFPFFGGDDIGLANHRLLVERCASPQRLSEFLQLNYKARYLIVNELELRDPESRYDIKVPVPVTHPDFREYFVEVGRVSSGVIYYLPKRPQD
jgi:hypothetical protein